MDLNDSDKIGLMLEFLFSILVTRFYGQNEDIFFLPKNIPIKIEVPNTFINFFEKFYILKLFRIKEIKIDKLAPLIVPENINCNIEIVANYLKALKENRINEYDLIFEGITPKDLVNKKTSLKPELISAVKCQELIFEAIKNKIEEPNYYQIISFINV